MANFQDLADVTPVLKNVYLPIRKKVFPLSTPLAAASRRGGPDRVTYSGNDLFFNVKLGRRGGFVASAAGFLPDAQSATERQGRLGIARTYATIEADGLGLKATDDPKGATISLAKKLVEDVMEEWQLEQERVLHGDSRAVRAVVDTVNSTTSIIVDNPYGITDAGPGNLHLVVGDTINVRSSDGLTSRGKAAITAISLSGDAATLTLGTAVSGMVAGDVVVTAVPSATSATDSSYGAEPHGLKSIMDVENSFATFEQINDARWVAQKLTAPGGDIDETVIMQLLLTIESRAGVSAFNNPKSHYLVTTPGIWKTYGESLLGYRRFTPPSMTLEGGFKAVEVAGAALIRDPWSPRGRLYAVHMPDTIYVDLMDFGQLKYQDAPRWKQADKRDAWEANFATYWNWGITNRASMGVISSITDATNYSPIF